MTDLEEAAGHRNAATRVVDVASRHVAVVETLVAPSGMAQAQREARRLLDAALANAGLPISGRRMTIWRPARDGLFAYAPGIEVPRAVTASGGVTPFTLPAGRAAHVVSRGGYAALPAAWQDLLEDCAAQGHGLAGLNWEVYAPQDTLATTELYALLS